MEKNENQKTSEHQSLESFITFLEEQKTKGTARKFTDYCISELKKRRDTQDEFDEELFQDAVKFVLRKLGALETEDLK
ncbi:hypothetical protein GF354_05205 [Candidatus Peregrinibacteria bacterium]|nr:hypothetical protein [Candidatus Peregrinibacteria bacterium]